MQLKRLPILTNRLAHISCRILHIESSSIHSIDVQMYSLRGLTIDAVLPEANVVEANLGRNAPLYGEVFVGIF